MDIELFDLIFELRKHEDAIYNEDGSIKLVRNIQPIFNEFACAEQTILHLSYIISDFDTIYRNMIDSYKRHTELDEYGRTSYVLAMTYTLEIDTQKKQSIHTELELKNLIHQRWRNFQTYITQNNLSLNLINEYSFQGILDQSRINYGYTKKK